MLKSSQREKSTPSTRDNTDALLWTLLPSLKLLPRPHSSSRSLPEPCRVCTSSSGLYPHSLSRLLSLVVLMATSPAYFRGFILIALKEGREGTSDDDYVGQYQVSARQREGGGGGWGGLLRAPREVLQQIICMLQRRRETTWLFPLLSPGCEGERC